MDRMLAICGLVCSDCPAFLATQSGDDEKKKEVARAWSSSDHKYSPEDIACNGCLATEGQLFGFCHECAIRACGIEREMENCGHCDEYACEKLDSMFDSGSEARRNLDEVRGKLKA